MVALFSALLAVAWIGYRSVLLRPGSVLAFNDGNIESALSPQFHFPAALVRIWDNQFFFGAGAKQYPLTVVGLCEAAFGPHHYRREAQGLILAVCALGVYWGVRRLGRSRTASLVASLTALLSAVMFTFSMAGLPVRAVAFASAVVAMGFMERGRREDRWLPYLAGGGVLGLGLTEVPDVGALFAAGVGLAWLWTHAPAWRAPRRLLRDVARFALLAVASVAVAFQTLYAIVAPNAVGVTQGVQETAEQHYNWATQWSVPIEESWEFVAPTWFGSSMRSDGAPYWGSNGRDKSWTPEKPEGYRNFRMTGWHVGTAAFVLFLAGAFCLRRRELLPPESRAALPWMGLALAGAALTLAVSWGRYFPLYRLVFALPYFGTMRNPEKWTGPATMFLCLGLAAAIDVFRSALTSGDAECRRVLRRRLVAAAVVPAVIAAGLAIYLYLDEPGFVARRAAEGYGRLSAATWQHAVGISAKVLLLSALAAALGAWALRPNAPPAPASRALAAGVAILVAADLLHADAFYVMGHRYDQYTAPNPLYEFIDAHRTEGRWKLLPPRHPVLNNFRLSMFMISGVDLFDPVSVSRMPNDYGALFRALDGEVRLWELGSCRYFLTLSGAESQLNALDGNRGRFRERQALGVVVVNDCWVPTLNVPPGERHLRIVEFAGALPKYRFVPRVTPIPDTAEGNDAAIRRVAAAGFDLAAEALIAGEADPPAGATNGSIRVVSETPAEVRLEVETPAPAWLVRSCKHDPDWRATVDGAPVPVRRANAIFQAVLVPAGRHDLHFAYRPSLVPLGAAAAGRILLMAVLALVAARRPRGTSP
jgi:hypothetical protein